MDKKLVGLLGAVAALGFADASTAGASPAPEANPLAVSSYSELLDPVPNAANVLATLDEGRSVQPKGEQVAQYYHHHHHHHHHGYFRPQRIMRGFVYGRRYHHHHHHHHHHYGY